MTVFVTFLKCLEANDRRILNLKQKIESQLYSTATGEFGLKRRRRRTTSLLNKVGEIVLTDKEYARNVTCYRFLMEQVLLAPKTE